MKRSLLIFGLLTATTLSLVGCGGGSAATSGMGSGSNQSAVFVTGEDAPLPSVVAFNVTLNSIALMNNSGSVTVLSTPVTVDFGRLMGLRSLLGFNTVAAGTYTSATFTLASPVISYVDLSTNPPSLGTINGALTSPTVTVAFPSGHPLAVGSSGLAGLHMDFNLRDSLQTDQNGQITGVVNPKISVQAVSAADEGGEITDFTGGLVSTNVSGNSFVMQGPWGFQETVDVNSQTQYNGSFSLASLPADGIISVMGTVQLDGSILATAVEVVTTNKAFISGRVLQVTPSSGAAHSITMYVGEELPVLSGNFARGQVVTLDVSQVSNYDVCFFNNWLTNWVFNSSSMVAGQRIFVGGTWNSSSAVFSPSTISLRRQGVVGQPVANSVTVNNNNQGSFQLQNNGLLGWVAQGPFTVNTNNTTNFVNIDGLAGLSSAGTASVVADGLVLKDPVSGQPQVYAHRVAVLQ
jgi:hypothetical protein